VITGRTFVCGIIGDPVEHTLSPAMHNTAFQKVGLDYVYAPFHVKKDNLEAAIGGMRSLGIKGLNVTIPHKISVLPLMDRLDPLAQKIGAVNTIVNESGALAGYNTDSSGFMRALSEAGLEVGGKRIVLLGAGGAARAIAFAVAEEGGYLFIHNRTRERAHELADVISDLYGIPIVVGGLDAEALKETVPDADIIINATSVGMAPDAARSPVPAELLCENQTVFDIVYSPIETRLLRESGERGAAAIDGLQMLVWQGALAFQLWTGQAAPVDVMRDAAMKVLRRGKK
jgi:shikimate dehydrogenase